MELKKILLERIEKEVTYEDGLGKKSIKEVIEDVFKEAESKQFSLYSVGCSETEVLQNTEPCPKCRKPCTGRSCYKCQKYW